MRALRVLIAKDLGVEFRTRETTASVLVLAFLMVLILGFAVPSGLPAAGAGGLLWVALVFPALQVQTRLWAGEADQGTLDALLAAPVSPSVLWLSKFLLSLILTGVLALVMTPVFLTIMGESVRGPWSVFVLGMALGVIGLAAVGSTLSILTSRMRLREALMPLMALPLSVPLFLGAVVITGGSLSGKPHQVGLWLLLMAVFDLMYIALPLLLADILVEV